MNRKIIIKRGPLAFAKNVEPSQFGDIDVCGDRHKCMKKEGVVVTQERNYYVAVMQKMHLLQQLQYYKYSVIPNARRNSSGKERIFIVLHTMK